MLLDMGWGFGQGWVGVWDVFGLVWVEDWGCGWTPTFFRNSILKAGCRLGGWLVPDEIISHLRPNLWVWLGLPNRARAECGNK